MRFYGAGRHYWTRIEEEDNVLCWIERNEEGKLARIEWRPRDDPHEFKGRIVDKGLNRPEDVQRFVADTLKRWGATPATHRVRFENLTDEVKGTRRWFYREGD